MPFASSHSTLSSIVKRSVFFSEELGLIWSNNVIKGIAPISTVLENDTRLEYVVAPLNASLRRELLSRVFILYDTKPKEVKERIASLARKTPYCVRLICSQDDSKAIGKSRTVEDTMLRPKSVLPRDTLLLLYVAELSELSLGNIKRKLTLILPKEKVINLISALFVDVSFCCGNGQHKNNILCIARYKPENKPLKHKILDAVFYMEKQELLTKKEIVLRYVSTVLLFPTLITPAICLINTLGRPHLFAFPNARVTRWQYYQHKKRLSTLRNVVSLLRDTSPKTEKYRKALFQLLIDRGYVDEEHTPTKIGKRTNNRHNLLLATPNSLLGAKQLAARCLLWATLILAIAGASAYFALSVMPLISPTKAVTALVVAAASGLLSVGVFAAHLNNKMAQYVIGGTVVLCLVCLATISSFSAISETLPFATHHMAALASFIIVCALTVVCMALVENFMLHKNDRAAADLLGLSLTTYLDVKPYVAAELRKCDNEHMMATACLNALEAGGADVSPLLDDPAVADLLSRGSACNAPAQ